MRRPVRLAVVLLALGCATSRNRTEPGAAGAARCSSVALGPVHFERIATWREDAKAAYSIIHDDMCDDGVETTRKLALPELARRGLHVGIAPIPDSCDHDHRWREVVEAAAAGHEIVSHSYSHVRITPENAAREVTDVKALLEKHVGRPVTFFVFPYDEYNPTTIGLVRKAGYLGARAGDRDSTNGMDKPPVSDAAPDDDFAVLFDVWPRAYSKYALYEDVDLLNVHVWDAVEHGGWAVREMHGLVRDGDPLEGHGFGPVPLSIYRRHLDFLVDARRANLVWTDTPTAVLRYRHARQACRASVTDEIVRFDASDADCVRFATPISVVVGTRPDLPGLRAVQNGVAVPVLQLAPGRFTVTADPTKGDVHLAGCAQPGRAVETDVHPTPRAKPAGSVCELETVVGKGGVWKLDDLERTGRSFDPDDLPNWSGYPNAAKSQRVREGAGTVLRFAGDKIGAWAGATYQFAGRDGSSACYDARSHHGLRFRMRGVVETPDDLAGKVFVSVITAETRPQRFGGDLKGEGGHFHVLLPVTREWRTVEVPWSALQPPGWGDTVHLTAPALGKLQAIDWGITNTATHFEIFLDDVELY